MTWSVRVEDSQDAGYPDTSAGILDLPVSIAAMVCETAGCGWENLAPGSQPGHLAAVVAGVRAWANGTAFDVELVEVASLSLGQLLEALEVECGAD